MESTLCGSKSETSDLLEEQATLDLGSTLLMSSSELNVSSVALLLSLFELNASKSALLKPSLVLQVSEGELDSLMVREKRTDLRIKRPSKWRMMNGDSSTLREQVCGFTQVLEFPPFE